MRNRYEANILDLRCHYVLQNHPWNYVRCHHQCAVVVAECVPRQRDVSAEWEGAGLGNGVEDEDHSRKLHWKYG